jgi:hypothetical protein
MTRVWRVGSKVLTGLFVTAMCAMSQSYTTSARPGVINYVEGSATLDGRPLSLNTQQQGPTYLNANDTLSTTSGKAEVLLTPGVFLRIGDNSAIRMISPDLTNTQVALDHGEAMIEVDQLVKDNNISVLDHGANIAVQQTGLYRLTADQQPIAATLDGKLLVRADDHKVELKKGHETELMGVLKAQKFDRNQEDALYAWSNVRSEYEAEASFQAAKNVYVNNYYGGFWGPGFWGGWGPGWYWDAGFSTWAWLPYDGAFFSPFGWGFYGPAYIPYVIGGGYGYGYRWRGTHGYVFRGTPNTHIAAGRVGGFASGANGGFAHAGAGGFYGGSAGGVHAAVGGHR